MSYRRRVTRPRTPRTALYTLDTPGPAAGAGDSDEEEDRIRAAPDSPSSGDSCASPFASATAVARQRRQSWQQRQEQQQRRKEKQSHSPPSPQNSLDRNADPYRKRRVRRGSMDVTKWKQDLLRVETTTTTTRTATAAPTDNGLDEYTFDDDRDFDTPTIARSADQLQREKEAKRKRKSKWEVAAELMFKKDNTASGHRKKQHLPERKNYQNHVQRMLLGRVKSKQQKKFDMLRQEMILARQPDGIVAAASKSLAGFRLVLALDRVLQRNLRCRMAKWQSFVAIQHLDEEYGAEMNRLHGRASWLAEALARKHGACVAFANRVGSSKRRSVLRRCLKAWRRHVRTSSSVGRRAMAMRKRQLRSTMRHSFAIWNDYVHANAVEVMQRDQLEALRQELVNLHSAAEIKVCRRTVLKMLHAKLNAAWEAWREFNRLKVLLIRVRARWLRKGLVRFFSTWRANSTESRRLRFLGARVVQRMLRRTTAAIFDRWRTSTTELRRLRLVGARVVKRMRQQTMAATFDHWRANVEESVRMRVICQRVGARWLRAALMRCLNSWQGFVAKRQSDKAIVRRWLAAVQNREIAGALRSWILFVQWHRDNAQLTELQALRQQVADMQKSQDNKVCRRVVLKMLNAKLTAAWEAWLEFNRLKGLLGRVGARWLKQGMIRSINKWRSFVQQRRRDRRVVERWLSAVMNREINTGFRAWVRFCRWNKDNDQLSALDALRKQMADMQRAQDKKVCCRVVLKMLNAKLTAAWEAWREFNRLKVLLVRVRARWLRQGLSRSFGTWRSNATDLRRMRLVAARVVKRMLKRSVASTFDRWRTSTAESRRLRLVGARVVKRMLLRTVAVTFDCWQRSVIESRRLRSVGARVVKRMLQRTMTATFDRWRAAASELRRLRVVGERVVKRMLQRTVATTFDRWRDKVHESVRMRVICQRVGARWLKAGLMRCLNTWQAFVTKRLDDKAIVRRWLGAVKNREISGAMRSWHLFVAWDIENEHKSEVDDLRDQLQALQQQAKERENRLCRRVVLRLLNAKLSAAWDAWIEHNRLKALLARVGARWLKKSMMQAFQGWHHNVEEGVRMRVICQRVGARWLRAALMRCLNSWQGFVAKRQSDKAIVRRWLAAVQNREIAGALRSWILFVQWHRDNAQLTELQALRQQVADMQKSQDNKVCRRVVLKMLNAKLTAAWEAWLEFNRLKGLLGRVGARWLKQGMIRSINKWRSFVQQRRRDRRVVERWLSAVMNREINTGFRAWVRFCRWNKDNDQLSALDALRKQMADMQRAQDKKVCCRVVLKMLNAKLTAAWEAWREFNRLKVLLVRVRARWLRQGLSRSFGTWRSNATDLRRMRLVAARVVKRMLKRSVASTFDRWRTSTAESRRLRLVGARVVKRMLLRTVAVTFDCWQRSVIESRRLRSVGARVVKRMLQRTMTATFDRWRAAASELRRLRVVGERVVKRMLQRTVATTFDRWRDKVHESVRMRVICQRVGARWLKAGLMRCLNTWQAFVTKRLDDKAIVRRWLGAVKNREISGAMRSWHLFVAWDIENEHKSEVDDLRDQLQALQQQAKERENRLCRRVVLRLLNAKLSAAWDAWIEHNRLKALLARVGARWLKKSMMQAFQGWHHNVEEGVRMREICKQVGARWLKAGLMRCVNSWQSFIAQRRDEKAIVRRWLAAVRNREIDAAWCSWTTFCQALRNQEHLSAMQAEMEAKNASAVQALARAENHKIRKRLDGLRQRKKHDDQQLINLREQLTSQKDMAEKLIKLRSELHKTCERNNALALQLEQTRERYEEQLSQEEGASGSRLTTLQAQLERAKEKAASALFDQQLAASECVASLQRKIKRAKEIMENKNNTIRTLRAEAKIRDAANEKLVEEKRYEMHRVRELKFRLSELLVVAGLIDAESNAGTEDDETTKRDMLFERRKVRVEALGLHQLESTLESKLDTLNGTLGSCGGITHKLSPTKARAGGVVIGSGGEGDTGGALPLECASGSMRSSSELAHSPSLLY